MILIFLEAADLCLNNNAPNSNVIFSITFGSGSPTYSSKTPSDFNFSTNFQQVFGPSISNDMFGFVNEVSIDNSMWHGGAFDHTSNDKTGYMFLVVVNNANLQFFNYQIKNLRIGAQYEFSAYLANAIRKARVSGFGLYVHFEVRAQTITGPLLVRNTTEGIFTYDTMTWSKHSVSFIATDSSIVLLMISHVTMVKGFGLAIDDIELRSCSAIDSFSLFTG